MWSHKFTSHRMCKVGGSDRGGRERPDAAPREDRLPQTGSDRRGERGIRESAVSYRGEMRNGQGLDHGCGLVSRHRQHMDDGAAGPLCGCKVRRDNMTGENPGKAASFSFLLSKSPSICP